MSPFVSVRFVYQTRSSQDNFYSIECRFYYWMEARNNNEVAFLFS